MYGNLILSKYPFVEAKDFDPTNEHGYSQQRVVIDFNGEQIAIYNIHLSMPIWTVDIPQLPFSLRMALGYNDSVRNNEIARLIPILQAEKLPFIMGGDFNMSDHSVTYQQLANVVGDSFREVGVGMGKSWPRPVSETDAIPDWMPPIIRIDYIWHSPQWAPINAEQGPYLGSDHLAVLAQFTLK
ncbi:MAG: endonuclease/exonuclease/phosphatase family protein [Anaerolineae bacterium]